jgi:uncharacterized protein
VARSRVHARGGAPNASAPRLVRQCPYLKLARECGLTIRSTGPIAACRHLARHFILGQIPSHHNGPVSSNVRPHSHVSGKHPKRTPRAGVDPYGRTPLHGAVINHNANLVAELLGSAANPDAQDDNGWTPLHFAAQANDAPITGLLLQSGANPNLCEAHGNPPLSTAVFNSRGAGETIQLLRDAGANPRLQNKYGVSPLSLARTIANYDVAQYFKDVADVNEA